MAVAVARHIKGVSNLDKPRLVARLTAWKRELSVNKKKPTSDDSSNDDDHHADIDNDTRPIEQGQHQKDSNGKPTSPIEVDREEKDREDAVKRLQAKLHEQEKLMCAQQSTIHEMKSALVQAQSFTEKLSFMMQRQEQATRQSETPEPQPQAKPAAVPIATPVTRRHQAVPLPGGV